MRKSLLGLRRAVSNLCALAAGAACLAIAAVSPAQAVEIQYWQYLFDSRVQAMTLLIKEFEAENPGITVKQVTFPYADYQTRIVAAKAGGRGPDVVQLFYGWLDNFIAGRLIQPLSKERFPAAQVEKDFFPIVSAMKYRDEYYGLPTAVRTMAMFYNKDLFQQAGLDPEKPPKTLSEFTAAAKAIAKRDAAGNYQTVGVAMDISRQDHNWWREMLVRQFGGEPYSADGSKVTYNSEGGRKALEFYTGLQTQQKVSQEGFMDEGQAAFRAGLAGMVIDGTFRIASFKTITTFKWGVAELPASDDGIRSNFGSYFANAIGASATGEKLAAAEKFLAFITSEKAMNVWLDKVGELPARRTVAMTEKNLADPVYGPFIRGLDYSHTTLFVDEAAQRQVAIDMINGVLLKNQPAAEALAAAVPKEQRIIDARKVK
ncbi:extracellular solute-binding protein [Bosea caraganae]|uniref:Extracellular solute-binding protein n=1 Tax=Bosea caraganae TaxID=2763117 RepID=A0A370L832_9HYPH|nr:extracellular solute-binding protein [Bosea caraganae]RDJ25210.1 extracellular solute-binding protein [Bosea caraganae]RDJ26320.1 extracellular solute-binding protein [Bosea caraganae]